MDRLIVDEMCGSVSRRSLFLVLREDGFANPDHLTQGLIAGNKIGVIDEKEFGLGVG
jgi:hypothetical protein